MTLNKMVQGGIIPAAVGSWPCKRRLPPCQWHGVMCTSGHITQLDFHGRELDGEIPAGLGDLSQLQNLYLAYSQLSGEIPPELGKLSQLVVLNLSGNQLSGEIPAELGSLSQLQWLILDNNQLSGEIPAELGNLSQLQWLILGNNQLNGEIPDELGNLSQLRWLYLSDNQLSGPLPDGLAELPINILTLSNTELCIPQTAKFETWVAGVPEHDLEEVPYCEWR